MPERKNLMDTEHLEAEEIFYERDLHPTKPKVLWGTSGAVVTYSERSKSFYKNAGKINLQEILQGFLPIKPQDNGRSERGPCKCVPAFVGWLRGRPALRLSNHFTFCVFGSAPNERVPHWYRYIIPPLTSNTAPVI